MSWRAHSFALLLLAVAPVAARADTPLDAELPSPEVLLTQRETLLLEAAQAERILALAREAQPRLDTLRSEISDATRALIALLRAARPDSAQAQQRFDALLALQSRLRTAEFQLALAVRSILSPEQIDVARQLRQPAPQVDPVDPRVALQQRLQHKFELLQSLLRTRPFGGESAPQLVAKVEAIQHLARNGQPMQAEQQLDRLIATLQPARDRR